MYMLYVCIYICVCVYMYIILDLLKVETSIYQHAVVSFLEEMGTEKLLGWCRHCVLYRLVGFWRPCITNLQS